MVTRQNVFIEMLEEGLARRFEAILDLFFHLGLQFPERGIDGFRSPTFLVDGQNPLLEMHPQLPLRRMSLRCSDIIQLLEGPAENVQMAFARIKLDKRHSDVTVIASGTTRERCFPDWYMGFKAVEANRFEQMEDFINRTKEAVKQDDCQMPIRLLASFVTKNRLDL